MLEPAPSQAHRLHFGDRPRPSRSDARGRGGLPRGFVPEKDLKISEHVLKLGAQAPDIHLGRAILLCGIQSAQQLQADVEEMGRKAQGLETLAVQESPRESEGDSSWPRTPAQSQGISRTRGSQRLEAPLALPRPQLPHLRGGPASPQTQPNPCRLSSKKEDIDAACVHRGHLAGVAPERPIADLRARHRRAAPPHAEGQSLDSLRVGPP